MSEAPRGTLLHHYRIDENGLITRANLVIATGHNNYAMSRAVECVVRDVIEPLTLNAGNGPPPPIPEGALNRIEAAIRAYDPCLSCSTHAVGKMPLSVAIVRV